MPDVEILSDSTQDTDRRERLWAYQQLPSLQGYLLVDTGTRAARLYTRTGTSWSEDYVEGAGTLTLPCVNISASLNEVYEGTKI
nr:Uma2 family endonuclease [Deinococcus soli (ex Cha et al. 2016)]